ncbi:MAG: ATP-binding cassette domain-containing protein [Phycisphaerales bacterium]
MSNSTTTEAATRDASAASRSHSRAAPVTLVVERRVRASARSPSSRAVALATMFGVAPDGSGPLRPIEVESDAARSREREILPRTTLEFRPGEITLVTGPSGAGKSSLLHAIRDAASLSSSSRSSRPPIVVELEHAPGDDGAAGMKADGDVEESDRALVDLVGSTLEDATRALARAGLADAFVMLRSPREVSEGQRHRFALARLYDAVESRIAETDEADSKSGDGGQEPGEAPPPPLILALADEFGAALDRATAEVVAMNLRRWLDSQVVASRVCVVLATPRVELVEALEPEVVVEVGVSSCRSD